MISVQPPSGFRDFVNDEARRRLRLMNLIAEVYQSFGFSPLETPALENLEVLVGGGGGEENEKLIFKVLKRGAKFEDSIAAAASSKSENEIAEFGLRFDMTVPLSRVVAAHRGEIRFPWKVFHIGPVWRAERPQKGRFREFVQCDVDIVGAKSASAELEVIQAVVAVLERIGVRGFSLVLNDRRVMQALGEKFGFTGEKFGQFAILLDKKDKLDLEELLKQFQDLSGGAISPELKKMLEGTLTLEEVSELHPQATSDLNFIISMLKESEIPLSEIIFDPSLARGMGYYTGPIFELRHPSAGYSFGGGGRYDKLIGRFTSQPIPACGFSIGFERLAMLLAEAELQSETKSQTIFFPVFAEELRGKIFKIANELRQEGFSVDVFSDQAKIKNQFKYASDAGYQWVVIAGQEEWANSKFKIKDFTSGTEIEVSQNELDTRLKALLFSIK